MKTFFAINRHNKTAVELIGFACFEEVQSAFRFGIAMPDGTMANGIGRCDSHADFMQRAESWNWTVLLSNPNAGIVQPFPRGRW